MLLTVVVAQPERLAALRDRLPLPGRVLRYSASNLASAFESVRANQPGLLVVDAPFAATPSGRAFIDRVTAILPKIVLQAAVFERGQWTMASLQKDEPAPTVPSVRLVAVTAGLDTRRTPRFLIQDVTQALAEGAAIKMVDLSILGAQIISQPMMRPNQKVKIALPDSDSSLQLVATIAWSNYERPSKELEPHFRVGMEFTNAVREALEDYCRRHCSAEPVSFHG